MYSPTIPRDLQVKPDITNFEKKLCENFNNKMTPTILSEFKSSGMSFVGLQAVRVSMGRFVDIKFLRV